MRNDQPPIGVRFFSWTAAIALVLAAVLLFRSPAAHPWLQTAAGLAAGIALLLFGGLPSARRYPVTASALAAAGIGILYATLYAMHVRWHLIPLLAAFAGMAIVTAAAVYLSTRHVSSFIAFLGLIGGFVTAALLSSNESYPVPVFAYLLLLDIGIAWIALRQGWPWLMGLSVALTAVFEWAWVIQSLDPRWLPFAAVLFLLFAIVGTSPLWYRQPEERWRAFQRIAAAAALMPLLFAIYVAAHPNYGPQYSLLFGFLLLADAGLLALAWHGAPKWLHAAGGIATLLTFLVWFRMSYTHASWPWTLLWFALFIALYLVRVTPFAHLLFFVFIGLASKEPPRHYGAILAVMLALLAIVLVVTIRRDRAVLGAIAVALSLIALMVLQPPLWLLLAVHAILFVAFFCVAWISERYVLAILAIPLYVAMIITAARAPEWSYSPAATLLLIAAVPCAVFLAYAIALGERAKASIAPHVAASLASFLLLLNAWGVRVDVEPSHRWAVGLVPLAETLAMLVLLKRVWRLEPRRRTRLMLVASTALVLLNAALLMLLPKEWAVVLCAFEVVLLVWLFTRLALRGLTFRGLLGWATALAAGVLLCLAFDAALYTRWYVYVLCGVAMFAAAFLARLDVPRLERFLSIAGLFEIWFLLNILIANGYHSANGALSFDFAASTPAENAAYTLWWAAIATGLLIVGLVIDWTAARWAATALLLATILKCFLNDVPHLDGVYLLLSLLSLAVPLVVAGIALQKWRRAETAMPN